MNFWKEVQQSMPKGTVEHVHRYAGLNETKGGVADIGRLFHDKAPSNLARTMMDLIIKFGWEIIGDPPYSPDLASSYYYFLFPT